MVSGFLIFLVLLAILLFIQIMKGAPFLPSKDPAVQAMIDLSKPRPGEKAADLGSGNGKILIALAQAGAEAHGFEINPLLVLWSNRKIRKLGLEDKASAHWKNFWRIDLSPFNIITVFGIDTIMPDLEKKLQKELQPGSRVVSNLFIFPTWASEEKRDSVRLYLKGQPKSREFPRNERT